MTKTPTYYAWYPAVERSKDIVSILLTRGVNTSAPKGGNEFGSSLLQACGIDVPVVMYSSDEFITSYFSTSRNDWQEAWDVRILLEGKAAARPKPLIRFPVLVAPTEQGQVRTQIPLRVIADFNSRKAAIACRDLLKAAARQQTIHLDIPPNQTHAAARLWNDTPRN